METLLLTLPLFGSSINTLSNTARLSLPALSAFIFVIIIAIFVSPLIETMKISFITVLFWLYRRNLDILFSILGIMYNSEHHQLSKERTQMLVKEHFDVIHNFHLLPAQPTIFICNYTHDRFEHIFFSLIPRKLVLVLTSRAANLGQIDTYMDVICTNEKGGCYDHLEKEIARYVAGGTSIFCYIQKPCFIDEKNYGKFRTGVFRIAKKLAVPITPIKIGHIQAVGGAIFYQPICVTVGKTHYVSDVVESVFETKTFLKS